MAFVDATIVNIAVPNIHHDFAGSQLSSVSWVLNAYNIVFAAFLVGGGQLADLLGRRKVFSFALVAFTLGSTLCAVAPTLGLLVAARVLQAAGAAMLVPSSLAIVLEAHAERERMHAVALWSAVAALAAGIGPPLGGLLITASSWRLVFLVNIPVGAVALVLAQRVLVESRAPGRRRVPDLLGGAVLALAIAALVLAVVKGQEWGWGGARVIGAFAIALLLSVYFVLRSSRQRAPVIDLSLLRIRSFALSNGVTVVMAGGFYAYTLCNVLFLTTVWRYSILTAGLALTPGPLTAMAVAGPASRVVERLGHRAVVAPGALVWAGGMAFFATTARHPRRLPPRLAARHAHPRPRRRAHLPHAQRRRRRLRARPALRHRHLAQLRRPTARRRARRRRADRHPRARPRRCRRCTRSNTAGCSPAAASSPGPSRASRSSSAVVKTLPPATPLREPVPATGPTSARGSEPSTTLGQPARSPPARPASRVRPPPRCPASPKPPASAPR